MSTTTKTILEIDGLVIKTPNGGRITIGAARGGHPEIAIFDPDGTRRTEIAAGLVGLFDEHDEVTVDVIASEQGSGLTIMDSSMTEQADDIRLRAQLRLDSQGRAECLVVDTDGAASLEAEAVDRERLDLRARTAAELRTLLKTHEAALATAERDYEQARTTDATTERRWFVKFEELWVRRLTAALRERVAADAWDTARAAGRSGQAAAAAALAVLDAGRVPTPAGDAAEAVTRAAVAR